MVLPSFAEVSTDKRRYCDSFTMSYRNNDYIAGNRLVEPYENNVCVVQNPPQEPLSREELDDVYERSYAGTYHPMYEAEGGVPGMKEVKFSIVSVRGCLRLRVLRTYLSSGKRGEIEERGLNRCGSEEADRASRF